MGASVVRGPSHADVHGHAWRIAVADVGIQGLRRVWRGATLARMHQETTPQAICCGLRSESLVRDSPLIAVEPAGGGRPDVASRVDGTGGDQEFFSVLRVA